MRAVALRVAFDGAAFHGTQRQTGSPARTVDSELLSALRRLGRVASFRPASRLDRGVSASGYVVAAHTPFEGRRLAAAASAGLEDAWVWATAEVEETFDPRRSARSRTYEYIHHRGPTQRFDLAKSAFATFRGRHDFRNFARVEAHRSPWREVFEASAFDEGDVWRFRVRGESFLWNQVRRMVGAALACADGVVEVEVVERSLSAPEEKRPARGHAPTLSVAPAPAEGLVLTDIDIGVEWIVDSAAERRAREALQERSARFRILGERAATVARLLG